MIPDRSLKEIGVWQYGVIPTEKILFSGEVRRICEGNVCRLYGTTWACPPAVGTVEECRQRCLAYPCALVFSARYPLEDSFDCEGMAAGHAGFKALCDRLHRLAAGEYPQTLLLSNEGCRRCGSCSYPDGPCRLPDVLFPSIEGYGIRVKELADAAGIAYNNGKNTVTYFGALFFRPGKTECADETGGA
jgi:predicted metal-binding protein